MLTEPKFARTGLKLVNGKPFDFFQALCGGTKRRMKVERCGMSDTSDVWSSFTSDVVMKTSDDDLIREFDMHCSIVELFAGSTSRLWHKQVDFRINVPAPLQYVEADDESWPKLLCNLPDSVTEASPGLVSERIMGFQLSQRMELAQRYCPNRTPMVVAAASSTFGCLVRPYLGLRRPVVLEKIVKGKEKVTVASSSSSSEYSEATTSDEEDPKPFTPIRDYDMRRFALHLDQVRELELPYQQYAIAMADAYAFLHWVAQVDAYGVEFVLAPVRNGKFDTAEPVVVGKQDFEADHLDQHALWMLDFGSCSPLDMLATQDVTPAVKAFWNTLPFAPRPGKNLEADQHLWRIFKARYILTSKNMLYSKSPQILHLTEELMDKIEKSVGVWST